MEDWDPVRLHADLAWNVREYKVLVVGVHCYGKLDSLGP